MYLSEQLGILSCGAAGLYSVVGGGPVKLTRSSLEGAAGKGGYNCNCNNSSRVSRQANCTTMFTTLHITHVNLGVESQMPEGLGLQHTIAAL